MSTTKGILPHVLTDQTIDRALALTATMFGLSKATLPESVEDFYVRMRESRFVRQAVMDDYKATYGSMLDTVNRAAAKQADTTDGQAREWNR